MFALPMIIAVLQGGLLLTCYKYETPVFYKEHKMDEELERLLHKCYSPQQYSRRMDEIPVTESDGQEQSFG